MVGGLDTAGLSQPLIPPSLRGIANQSTKQVTPEGDLDGQMEPFYPSGLNPLDQPPGLLLSQPSHPHHL